jgi:hypothetical protein
VTSSENEDRERQLVTTIAKSATDAEKNALAAWATELLNIQTGNLSPLQKAKLAISLTATSAVIWPAVKILSREIKKIGWDERSWAARLGFLGVCVGSVLFRGQRAGIAALGTAIRVPLWLVSGAGASFLGVLVEEFSRKRR